MQRYGESYQKYRDKTGMFLPKFLEDKLPKFPTFFPNSGGQRIFALFAAYCFYIVVVSAAGIAARDYALSRLSAIYTDNQAIVSVAPVEMRKAIDAIQIATRDTNVQSTLSRRGSSRLLLYVVPREWNIPELGLEGVGHTDNVLAHPGTHGNSTHFNSDSLIVLITEPILLSSEARGGDIVRKSLSFDPILEILIDLKQSRMVKSIQKKNGGKWEGVPVPIF